MTRIGIVLLGTMGLGLLGPGAKDQAAPLPPVPPMSADAPAPFPPGTIFVVDTGERLHHFAAAVPGNLQGTVAITGLQPGETVLGIDFRPSTGQLYGLGSSSRLYVISPVTGRASPVGAGFAPPLNGAAFGFDFDPTTDRIRIVADSERNLRLNPDTGAVEAIDAPINPAGSLVGAAYSNNYAGAATTTLYGIDSDTDQLVIQNPPNSGTVFPVGGLSVNADGLVGFDIAPGTGIAYAAMRPASMNSHLYRIDLTTGVAQLDGPIGLGLSVRCLAAAAGPENVFAVTTGNRLLRFLSGAPGAIISKSPITGLQPGETVVGIDFRPADGLLYGVGSTSRLYRIDVATGGATQVGTGPFPTLLSGTDFGVDFDPRPEEDHLRVVSDAEQNLRIDPRDGAVVVDPSLSPAGHVVAAAYSDNFAGTTMTRLYHIDTSSGLLLTQMPPGSGALSAVGPLGRPTTALVGLDIAPNGMAFASLTAPGASTSGFHAVDLASGVATLLGTIGGGETIRDLAVRVHAEVIYALTHSGATFPLISFNAATPGRLLSSVDLTGLQPGESLVGIDFRPVTGRLYGIGTTSRLYTIDTGTGVATAVGGPFTPALNGINFGVDFDPRVDSLRVVSDAEQNLRIDPDTGTVNFIGGALNPPGNVTGLAYSSNFVRPDTTTLYDVDLSTRQLFTQNPNLGDLVLVGSLHPGINGSFEAGFDISSASGKAYLSAYEGPSVPFTPTLYTVNLQTGAATPIHPIGTSALVMDIAVALTPATFGFDTPGVFVPSSSVWFLRNATSAGPADVAFKYGTGGANLVPIRGDWDGDGDDTPGLYDRTTGRFFLRNSSSAGPAEVPPFAFGPGGASFLPIAGDWDGDGVDTVGLRNTATGEVFLKNTNAAGAADLAFVFGAPGGIPIAGDWNNDGIDTIGLYVPATATFFLHNAHAGGVSDFLPFTFGAPGLAPLAGDWNGDGVDSIGVHDSATASWFLANRFTGGAADVTFTYGPPGAIGLAGDWDRR